MILGDLEGVGTIIWNDLSNANVDIYQHDCSLIRTLKNPYREKAKNFISCEIFMGKFFHVKRIIYIEKIV